MWNLFELILMLPIKAAMWCIKTLGRTVAVIVGLLGFGIGALMGVCCPLLWLIGAPLMLVSAIVVVKAF
ncbi:TPA: hypothetical protein DDW35_05775 [Candidatus Sumerlaeota bacterium]|jgi:hypothetical protein|nr:hypothetical protein [Candidatus Sumerlaeota bacterium]